MALDVIQTRECLRTFDLERLFIEQLGWNHHAQSLMIAVEDSEYELSAIAEKRGMVAFTYIADNEHIPDHAMRRKIELKVAKSVHEHLIIFVDRDQTTQIWQWVRRETGKPAACREHVYNHRQPGDALIQKLQAIAFSLEEEEQLTLPHVTSGARAAFDIERVTKRFYDLFKTEHVAFLKFLKGIPNEDMQRWYVSVMINRLMFIYFIQKKGFLNDNVDYLRDKLAESKRGGKDRFYVDLLCPLFFEGFARKKDDRSPAARQLLGKIPYLNGGIFQRHQLEELHGQTISIPDAAFERLFAFFDQYHWHLDERPLRADNEINPDVLGYIFEKYINQKQMGAYYTKEDITGYISQNTVIPRLFDMARQKCRIAFEGERSVWNLLQEDPDRYIYEAVKKGVDLPLPEEIAAGANDVTKRTGWNRAAPAEYALPTEIWREVVTRRKRHEEVWTKLVGGEVNDINDLITYNLDIRQFTQDVVETSEGPELLRAFWQALNSITVLDPACGSGAFLFAALNILEPLYEACLNRMQVFLDELEHSEEKHRPEKFSDFRKALADVEEHPNLRYFILKSIVLNNLYGIDIMPEATEICKLRLFLKLVAQVEEVEHVEPLPDIDFNIQTGNTLVGFTSREHIVHSMTMAGKAQMKMLSAEDAEIMQRIEEKAEYVDRLFTLFRQQQTELGGEVKLGDKEQLRKQLRTLEGELNGYLAGEYGVVTRRTTEKGISLAYQAWLDSHLPFHWFVEFYGIMKDGGFDVIIGNPPYVEYTKVKDEYTIRGYRTESCGNLHAYVFEQCSNLMRRAGRVGLIVPMSVVSSARMAPLQSHVIRQFQQLWLSHFSERPSQLFTGSRPMLTIVIGACKSELNQTCSTTLHRWYAETRTTLFDRMSYCGVPTSSIRSYAIPKYGDTIDTSIGEKLLYIKQSLGSLFINASAYPVIYNRSFLYWFKSFTFYPKFFASGTEKEQSDYHQKTLYARSQEEQHIASALLNSSLFYWYTIKYSNGREFTKEAIWDFPFDLSSMIRPIRQNLILLCKKLMTDLDKNSRIKETQYKSVGTVTYQEFFFAPSKPSIDEIDRALAKYYSFTEEELDFIINYDIKYRMSKDYIEGND